MVHRPASFFFKKKEEKKSYSPIVRVLHFFFILIVTKVGPRAADFSFQVFVDYGLWIIDYRLEILWPDSKGKVRSCHVMKYLGPSPP